MSSVDGYRHAYLCGECVVECQKGKRSDTHASSSGNPYLDGDQNTKSDRGTSTCLVLTVRAGQHRLVRCCAKAFETLSSQSERSQAYLCSRCNNVHVRTRDKSEIHVQSSDFAHLKYDRARPDVVVPRIVQAPTVPTGSEDPSRRTDGSTTRPRRAHISRCTCVADAFWNFARRERYEWEFGC